MSDNQDQNQEQTTTTTTTTTTAAAATDAAAASATAQQPILTFSNDFLLKIDTQDCYSTGNAIKKHIAKQLPSHTTKTSQQDTPNPPLFPGMTRIGKNPSNSIAYFNFSSEEDRENAKKLLLTCKFRGRQYVELPVTKADLKVSHRGAGKNAGGSEYNNNKKQGGQQQQHHDQVRRDRVDGGDDNKNQEIENEQEGDSKKNNKFSTNVAPWFHISYQDQLERKAEHCKKVLKVISSYHNKTSALSKSNDTVEKLKDGSLLEGVLASPDIFGYRNNVQVTAGYSSSPSSSASSLLPSSNSNSNSDAQQEQQQQQQPTEALLLVPTFGFMAGSVVEGKSEILPAELGAPTSHPAVVPLTNLILEEVVKPLLQKYPTFCTMYTKNTQKGFWRRIQFRFNEFGDTMMDIEISDAHLLLPSENNTVIIEEFKQMMIDCFQKRNFVLEYIPISEQEFKQKYNFSDDQQQEQEQEKKDSENENAASSASSSSSSSSQKQKIQIKSVQYHIYNGHSVSGSEIPRQVIYGSNTLTERLFSNLHFDLSPTDFFQVNRNGMHLLLNHIKTTTTNANLSKEKTLLLDLCSGTGTLGLAFADSVKKVIGIEIVATAVENAKQNAIRNNISNAEFVCGKVEVELPKVLGKCMREDPSMLQNVVAILDPPRVGVNNTVLKALRNVPGLSSIIYISCEQRALENNCEPLTKESTGKYFGEPFVISNAFGVDLFPHTHHVEMIAVLRRGNAVVANAEKIVSEKVEEKEKEDEKVTTE